MTLAMCASGARSPEAPTEPCSGTTGVTRRSIMATSMSMTSGRTPDTPMDSECARSSSMARTTSRGVAGPTPALCERSRFSCRVRTSSGAMCVSLSLPKPVVTPYTTLFSRTAVSTTRRLACTRCRASPGSSTRTSPRATSTTSSSVSLLTPSRITDSPPW